MQYYNNNDSVRVCRPEFHLLFLQIQCAYGDDTAVTCPITFVKIFNIEGGFWKKLDPFDTFENPGVLKN